ncbi:serine/threonine-protein kinase [Polyangium sorediatum]|uniref:non-specific serine/threonine protein kinase n=1 Tax=Polyangium sorediatum TaxID=889274 RepID=A0ABT6NY42_9BACT|nr:serine/threonine-protein kinase [Polyangium sorediatum]MDI1433224.1 serine/threonine-protein kinase [Polyangium sorediatum]
MAVGDSHTLEDKMHLDTTLPPNQFRFKYGRLLGEGGLGRVDEIVIALSNCVGLQPGQRLACKRLNDSWKDHPVMRQRFEREIAALKAMSHTAIVAYQGENLGDSLERFYIMPLYPKSLRDLLGGYPDGIEAGYIAGLGARLADALQYAHNLGFIHRDLKPENVLMDAQNNPVIADWGLGYFVHKHSKVLKPLTMGGMGTEYYCSLEQWNTGKCDNRGDVYSLGIMLAELLTGRQTPINPVGGGIRLNVLAGYTEHEQRFNALIQRMTYVVPSGRPSSMAEVATELWALANW